MRKIKVKVEGLEDSQDSGGSESEKIILNLKKNFIIVMSY